MTKPTLLQTLAKRAGISEQTAADIVKDSRAHYHCFVTRKRSGDARIIAAPDAPLMNLQRAAVAVVFKAYPVSKYNRAYEKGCSVRAAVWPHRRARHIATLDIKAFFPSIGLTHFYMLLDKEYENGDVKLLWDICSFNGGLPVGAPSSPFIANRIMALADKQIFAAAKACGARKFTRYADDLIFSARKRMDRTLERQVNGVLYDSVKLSLNPEKTRFMGKGQRRAALGLVLSGKRPALGLRRRRVLETELFRFIVKNEGDAQRIMGKLTYAEYIEPGFIRRMRLKLNKFQHLPAFWKIFQ